MVRGISCSVMLCILLAESGGGPSLASAGTSFLVESGGWLVERMRRAWRVDGGARAIRGTHRIRWYVARPKRRGTAAGAGRAVRLARNKVDGRTGRARPLPGAMRPKRCHDRLCQRARCSGACKLQILCEGHEQPMTRFLAPARGLFTDRSILDLSLDFR